MRAPFRACNTSGMSAAQPAGWAWTGFSHDPRLPSSAALRASDRDRDVALQALSEAYADGRLDREEHESRTDAAMSAKVLGDLPPLIADLVPDESISAGVPVATADVQTQAVQAWRRRRNNAAMGMAGPSVMTTGIWAATAIGSGNIYFFWPVFVILGTGMNVLRTMFSKQDIIESERDRIERKARKATPGGPGPAGR